MKTSSARHRRGESHPTDARLVFLRYKLGKEVWVTTERLMEIRSLALTADAAWRKTPKGVEVRREEARSHAKKPHIKKYRSDYYKRSDVRERRRPAANESARRHAKTEKGRATQKRFREKPETKVRMRRYRKDYLPRYHRERTKRDPHFRLTGVLRHRIWLALKSQKVKKSERTEKLIGCSFAEFRQHIEKQFQPGMTWENYGRRGWEIDHRVPLAAFNLADPEQQKLAFNFHNQRPMWRPANRAKNDLMEHEGKTVRGRDLRVKNIIPFRKVA